MISYNSCDSVLQRDYTVLDCKLIKLNHNHNQCLNDNQKNVSISPLSENLLKLLYSKFLLNYQVRLMNNSNRSGSYHNCSQIRTEYYNDFDDCLREYKNQKLKLQKQSKIQRSSVDAGESDEEYLDARQSHSQSQLSIRSQGTDLDVSATPSPTLTSPVSSNLMVSSNSPSNQTLFTSPLSTRQDVSSRRLSSDSTSTIFASPPSTSRKSPISQEIILDPAAYRDMSSPSTISQHWLASPPSHKSSRSASSSSKKHRSSKSKSPSSKCHKHRATPSPPSKKSSSSSKSKDAIKTSQKSSSNEVQANLMTTTNMVNDYQGNKQQIDKIIMSDASNNSLSNKNSPHEGIINNSQANYKQPTKTTTTTEIPTINNNKNNINENARKIVEKANLITTITTPTSTLQSTTTSEPVNNANKTRKSGIELNKNVGSCLETGRNNDQSSTVQIKR